MNWYQNSLMARHEYEKSKKAPPSKLTNEDRLRRFIYVTNMKPKFYSGGHEKYRRDLKHKANLMEEMFGDKFEDFLSIITAASEDKLLPYRSQLFSLLTLALNLPTTTAEMKPRICAVILKICKSNEDFFDFIKFSTIYRIDRSKLAKTVRTAVCKYYKKMTPLELAQSYAVCKSLYSWTHKDVIKLGHFKPDSPLKNAVVNYILFKKFSDEPSEEEKPIIDILKKADTLRKTTDHKVAVPLINEMKATIDQVEPSLRKSAEVWNSVLLNMSIPDILKVLTKLYKLGFLKKDAPTQTIINEALTNEEKIKESGIHPIEVFIRMKNFEKGGRPLDPKLLNHLSRDKQMPESDLKKLKSRREPRCPMVISNMQKCMITACGNVQPTGKRYLVTIDTTAKMDMACLCNKNITAIEAAAAFVWFLMKVEKDVTVAVFNESEVFVVRLDKRAHMNEHVQKLRFNRTNYVVPAAPIEWAASRKKHFDIFLTFIHYRDFWAAIPKDVRETMTEPEVALERYRDRVNLPNAKLVTFCLTTPKLYRCDGSPNVMDVAGFDSVMPRAVESFCRGAFI